MGHPMTDTMTDDLTMGPVGPWVIIEFGTARLKRWRFSRINAAGVVEHMLDERGDLATFLSIEDANKVIHMDKRWKELQAAFCPEDQ